MRALDATLGFLCGLTLRVLGGVLLVIAIVALHWSLQEGSE